MKVDERCSQNSESNGSQKQKTIKKSPIGCKDMLEVLTSVDQRCQTESKNCNILKQKKKSAVDYADEQRQITGPCECRRHTSEHCHNQLQKKTPTNQNNAKNTETRGRNLRKVFQLINKKRS